MNLTQQTVSFVKIKVHEIIVSVTLQKKEIKIILAIMKMYMLYVICMIEGNEYKTMYFKGIINDF